MELVKQMRKKKTDKKTRDYILIKQIFLFKRWVDTPNQPNSKAPHPKCKEIERNYEQKTLNDLFKGNNKKCQ